ncbi:MAG TPA: hypothetical protein VK890_11315 [Bacteroidia bacterium]|jgi:hypothetical protein|nr:hypothetical protein [Bacteroidia bacterium]
MKAINYLIILAVSVCIFNSCTKDVAGPTGPTGPQGAQGPSSSYKVTIDSIQPSQWLSSGSQYYFTIAPVTYLTTSNSNIVEVYYSLSLGQLGVYYELPLSPNFSSADWLYFDYSNYEVNMLYLGSTAPSQQIYVKIIIITQP